MVSLYFYTHNSIPNSTTSFLHKLPNSWTDMIPKYLFLLHKSWKLRWNTESKDPYVYSRNPSIRYLEGPNVFFNMRSIYPNMDILLELDMSFYLDIYTSIQIPLLSIHIYCLNMNIQYPLKVMIKFLYCNHDISLV